MRVDRGGARLQPYPRRRFGAGDGLADDARRGDPRLQDLLAIGGVVATVDAAAREVDNDVRAVDLALPVAAARAIPLDDAPRTMVRLAAEHDDVVAVAVKGAREDRADLS